MRERRTAIMPVACSPAYLADALMVRPEVVAEMIRAKILPVYKCGTKRRVLVADAILAVRKTWKRES
jgi:hypothetical protein